MNKSRKLFYGLAALLNIGTDRLWQKYPPERIPSKLLYFVKSKSLSGGIDTPPISSLGFNIACDPTERIKIITTTVNTLPYVFNLTNRDKSFMVPKAINNEKIINTV